MSIKWQVVIYPLLAGAVCAAFIYGQIFYYNKKVGVLSRFSPAVEVQGLSADLNEILQKKILLHSDNKDLAVPPEEFKTWLEKYTRGYTGKEETRIKSDAIELYLQKISKKLDNLPVNARLTVENGKVFEFQPAREGQTLNIPISVANIMSSLIRYSATNQGSTITARLAFDTLQPEVTLDKANTLGIDTLLASGESDFAGSPKFRTHNIGVGSQKFTGIIVKPGDTFSFNEWLGPVDATTGYQPELVIKSNTLVPEYGGGLCQVSTTLFRAAAEAGLPITERHPHSLPVRYYNPQGYDATIYPGVSDLKFKNDTAAYILIQSRIVGSKIYFDIYGTTDSRKVVIDGPHQYDIQKNGALKAILTRTVTYLDGTEKKDTFKSSYKSPALFQTVRNPLE